MRLTWARIPPILPDCGGERVGRSPLCPRDPLEEDLTMEMISCDLEKPYSITSDESAQFRRDGHILLHGVASAEEIELYRPLITGLVDELARGRSLQVKVDDTNPLFIQATNVWLKSEAIREFVFARRFARIAAELMAVRGVRLYHDQALIKEPGGYATPWHKDHYYWPLATHHTVKMWLALTDIQVDMGAMRFATGTHRSGMFPEIPISYDSQELFDRIIHDHKIPVVSYSMKAGDASFHSGDLLHAALANTSMQRREVIAIIYCDDGARVMKPNHEHRRIDMEEYLPGLTAGDLAASALNPLLYESDQ
jgi:ectoine hydroxylase-related dioxygenase (phytanoyl-CoA dioxygenase family)